MPYELRGRNVLVTGGSRGLGVPICQNFAKEGCNVVVNYMNSKAQSDQLATKLESEHKVKAYSVQGDMGVEADCVRVVKEAISHLGGLDIIISNAGYTKFSQFSDIHASDIEDWDKCYAVNVKAQLHLMRAASSTFQSNADGGVFIMTSSIAGGRPGGSSMPYSVTKAAQLHLMKCLATTEAPKCRVNAVMPGLLLTEWGLLYPAEVIETLKQKAKLKNATDLQDCAQTFVDLARNSSMTGQQIVVDSGLME